MLRRQHRVVPEVRLFPVVLLFPLRASASSVARHVRRVAEADRLPHALVAHGAADLIDRVRRVAAEVRRQVRMRRERLRVLLVALASIARWQVWHRSIFGTRVKFTSSTTLGRMICWTLMVGAMKSSSGAFAEVVLDEARREDVEPRSQPVLLQRAARRSASGSSPTSPVNSPSCCCSAVALGRRLLDLQIQLGHALARAPRPPRPFASALEAPAPRAASKS